MPHRPAYQLTAALVAANGGAAFCLDDRAIGRRFRLYAERPGPELNELISRAALAGAIRADIIEPSGAVTEGADLTDPEAITIVRIDGPIEQRAGYHDPCGGWSDGHDAIAERMIAALETGDVLLVIDSPGGAHAGLQEAVRRVIEEKEEHGRRVTVYADEMIGSAAYWWAAAVGDEIYGPESMLVGSIGARSAHVSEAAHLANEGIAVTYFAAPGAGKVAFAPELPLSDLGKERGDRDVWVAFDAFANAVGPRRGMSREEIVELNADVLPGAMAVSAKLADGVATLEEVIDYALALAGADTVADESAEDESFDTEGEPMANQVRSAVISAGDPPPAEPEKKPEERTEDPPPAAPAKPGSARAEEDPKEPAAPPPKADKAECEKCGAANDDDAKYCDNCGTQMPGQEEDDSADENEEEDSADDDEERAEGDKPDADDRRAQPPPPDQDRAARTARAARRGTLASIFGLRDNASEPAIKSAALAYVALGKAVMATTGAKTTAEAQGKLQALADDAADVVKMRGEVKAMKKRENYAERMALLTKLATANIAGYPRGDLLIDREVGGKRVVAPAPFYASTPLGQLRGFVSGKLASGSPATPRDPFAPRKPTTGAQAEALAATEIDSPFIQELAGCTTANVEQLAKTAAALKIQELQGAST